MQGRLMRPDRLGRWQPIPEQEIEAMLTQNYPQVVRRFVEQAVDLADHRYWILRLVDQLVNDLNTIADVISVLQATNGGLRVLPGYFKQKETHAALSENLVSLTNQLLKYPIDLMEDPDMVMLRTAVMSTCDAIQGVTRANPLNPQELTTAIQVLVNLFAHMDAQHRRDLTQRLRTSIDRGGRPPGKTDPVLDAIWECGIALYRVCQSNADPWRQIIKHINGLLRKPAKLRNASEQLIYDAWIKGDLKPDQKKRQVRQAFSSDRSTGGKTGI